MTDLSDIRTSLPSDNDRAFFSRVWGTDPEVYRQRLLAAGMYGHGRVLDAGCGFGQWTAALARMNAHADGLDVSDTRISAARAVAARHQIANAAFSQGHLEAMPYADASFDAVFSYSVLYLTDYRRSIREVQRILKPGGLFYLNTNGLGWYLHNLIDPHNPASDFDPRRMAARTLANTITYFAQGRSEPGASIVMPREQTLEEIAEAGFEVIASGADGTIRYHSDAEPRPFYQPTYHGEEGVWEALCRRASHR